MRCCAIHLTTSRSNVYFTKTIHPNFDHFRMSNSIDSSSDPIKFYESFLIPNNKTSDFIYSPAAFSKMLQDLRLVSSQTSFISFETSHSNYILKEKSNSNVNLSSAVQTPAVSETELFGACRKMVLWRAIHNICMICLLKNRKIIFCCRLFALANNELANRFCSSQLSATLLQR